MLASAKTAHVETLARFFGEPSTLVSYWTEMFSSYNFVKERQINVANTSVLADYIMSGCNKPILADKSLHRKVLEYIASWNLIFINLGHKICTIMNQNGLFLPNMRIFY